MREFFRGWKRKVGCVMLVMACLLSAGWVRSISIADDFTHITDRTVYRLTSNNSRLVHERTTIGDEVTYVRLLFQQRSLPARKQQYFHAEQWEWQWRFAGFESGTFVSGTTVKHITIVPYWSVVLPLTAISAWLLLSKPRTKPEPAITPASENA